MIPETGIDSPFSGDIQHLLYGLKPSDHVAEMTRWQLLSLSY